MLFKHLFGGFSGFFFACFMLFAVPSSAQQVAQRAATEAEWKAAKSGIDYTGLKKEAPPEKVDTTTKKPFLPEIDAPSADFFASLGWFGQNMLMFLMLGLVAYLLYSLIGSGLFLRNKTVSRTAEFDINEVEEHLHTSDLDRFLQQALANTDYRMAIRIYYLNILKKYSLAEKIIWQREKTNRAYESEIRQNAPDTYPDFCDATFIFERVWYGEMPVTAADYSAAQIVFERLQNRI